MNRSKPCCRIRITRRKALVASRRLVKLRELAEMLLRRRARKQFDIRVNHDADKLLKSNPRFPIQDFLRLGSVPKQQVDLGRTLIASIVFHVVIPIEIYMPE